MANLSKTVEIIFGGKNEISGVIGQVERDFAALDKSLTKIADPLAKLGTDIAKIDAALLALAIGGMAYAIKQSSEFNKSFALISTSITATGPALDQFRNDVLSYAGSSVKSLADINAALYTAAQAGIKYSESLAFLNAAEKLSVANNANLNTTVDLLTGTMNAYGFGLKDVTHINDVFFTSTLIGKQTIDELGTSMGQVVGIAANAGVSFEELSAAIATLTAKGMTTENAITAVKNVITSIIAPSAEASKASAALGLNFSLTELTAKGFAGMLAEVQKKTGGSKEKMVELFNEVRAMNGVLSLTGDGMKFFNSALDQTKNSAGSAEKAYSKMAVTFANQMQTLTNVANVTMIEIGTKLEPTAAKIAGSFSGLFKGIKIGVDQGAFDPLFKALDEAGGGIAKWLKDVSAAFPEALSKVDFGVLADAMERLGEAFKKAFSMDEVNPKTLAEAMQLVVDSLGSLLDVTKGMGEVFAPFLSTVKEAVTAFNNLDSETKTLAGNMLGLSMVFKAFGPLGLLLVAFGSDAESMSKTFTVAFGAIENGINTIKVAVLSLAMVFSVASEAMAGLLGYVPGYDNTKDLERTSDRVKIIGNLLDEAQTKLAVSSQKVSDAMFGAGEASAKAESHACKFGKTIETLPPKVAAISAEIAKLPAEKEIGIKVLADGSTIEKANGLITKTFPDGRILITNVAAAADDTQLSTVQKKIDKAIPDKKEVDIQAKLDTEKLKAQSEIIQKSVEWKARLDIANVEANAKIMENAFKSINTAIESTGVTLSNMLGLWTGAAKAGTGTLFIETEIQRESKRRDEALELQRKLIEAQIEQMQARTKAMDAGQALIQIDGKGLQPHLEAFMFEILSAIQVRATAEGQKYLVGI